MFGIIGDLPTSTSLGGVRKSRYKDVMTISRLQTKRDTDPFFFEGVASYPNTCELREN